MPFRFVFASLALLLGTGQTACQTTSPAERRAKQAPEIFNSLSEREKSLVLRGEVTEGMSRDAVTLAWGRPGRVSTGSRDGREREHWAYFHTIPVRSVSFGYGTYAPHPYHAAYGVHPRFGYAYGRSSFGFDSGVDYLPHIDRTVEFANGRVVAWERRR